MFPQSDQRLDDHLIRPLGAALGNNLAGDQLVEQEPTARRQHTGDAVALRRAASARPHPANLRALSRVGVFKNLGGGHRDDRDVAGPPLRSGACSPRSQSSSAITCKSDLVLMVRWRRSSPSFWTPADCCPERSSASSAPNPLFFCRSSAALLTVPTTLTMFPAYNLAALVSRWSRCAHRRGRRACRA